MPLVSLQETLKSSSKHDPTSDQYLQVASGKSMEGTPAPKKPLQGKGRWDVLPPGFPAQASADVSLPQCGHGESLPAQPPSKRQRRRNRQQQSTCRKLGIVNSPIANRVQAEDGSFETERGPPNDRPVKKQKRKEAPFWNRPESIDGPRQNFQNPLNRMDLCAELDTFYGRFRQQMQSVGAASAQAMISQATEIEGLNQRNQSLSSELEAGKEALKKVLTSRIGQEQVLAASQRAEEGLQARNKELRQEIDLLRKERDVTVKKEKEELSQERDQALARCLELEAKVANLVLEKETTQKELEHLREELQVASAKASVVDQRLGAETVAKNVLAVRLKASKADADSWQKIVQGMRGRLEEAQRSKESETQVRALATLQEHCTSLESSFDSLSDKLGLQSSKPQDIRLAIIALQTKLKSAEDKVSQTEKKRREGEKRLQEEKSKLERKEAEKQAQIWRREKALLEEEHKDKLSLERKEAERQVQLWQEEKKLLEEAVSNLMAKLDEQTKLTGLGEVALLEAIAEIFELKAGAAYLEGAKEGLKRALEEERKKNASIKEKGQESGQEGSPEQKGDSCKYEQQAPQSGATENIAGLEGTETELQVEQRNRQDAEEKLRALEASQAELTKRVESNLCLCLENEVNTAVVPCGHCLCSSCWTRHEKRQTSQGKKGYVPIACPICRDEAYSIQPLFRTGLIDDSAIFIQSSSVHY